jgi:hypothetical protein
MFYIVVCGSRGFNDYKLLETKLNLYLSNIEEREKIIIVSGGANGADLLGETYAIANKYPVLKYPADWIKHKKTAGFIRNAEMIKIATHVIAFWDGKSTGTKHAIELATHKKIPLRVVKYMEEQGDRDNKLV